jgi:hypothetical protein
MDSGIVQEYTIRTKTWTTKVQLIIYDRIIKTNTKLITKVAVLVTVIGI